MTNLDRLGEDLFLWATEEFSLVELNDAHCRTSVIMPQKKNPYGLAHIRGHARNLVGTFTGLVCNGLTPSGQPDNRVFAYHDLPEAIDDTRHCVELMRDILAGSRFDTERMSQAARQGYAYATDLCDFLVVETGIDNRSAHRLVGLAVSKCSPKNAEITASDVREAAAALGIELPAFDAVAFERNREPEVLIGLRRGVGGAAAEPMTAMLTEARAHIDRALQAWQSHSDIDFESRFLERIGDLAGDPSCPTIA
jgi:argininosuccinate lyase